MKTLIKAIPRFCACLLLAIFLVACSRVTQENFDKIQPGMTMEQVVTILGNPTTSESMNVMGLSGTSAQWKDNNAVISIQFFNNTVQVKTFNKVGATTKPQ